MKKIFFLSFLLFSICAINAQVQYRTPTLVVCNLESDRNLNWGQAVLIHTLETGMPSLTDGHWWRICNGLFVEVPPPGIITTGKMFVQTANKVVANTSVETSLIGTGKGSKDLTPLVLVEGMNVIVVVKGFGSRAAGNATINIKLGSTVIGTTGAILVGALANDGWEIRFSFTVRTAGVSGVVDGEGRFQNMNSGNILQMTNLTTTSIDLSSSKTIDVTLTWGNVNVGNSFTCTECVISI